MEKIDLFDRYINGDLMPDERQEFESRLSSDNVLAEQFNTYRLAVTAIISEAQQDGMDLESAVSHLSREEFAAILKGIEPLERNEIIDIVRSKASSDSAHIISRNMTSSALSSRAALADGDSDTDVLLPADDTKPSHNDNDSAGFRKWTILFIFIIILVTLIAVM